MLRAVLALTGRTLDQVIKALQSGEVDALPENQAQQEEILDILGRIDCIVMTLERDFGSQRRR